MTTAVKIFQGKFGRVALLECDKPLVTHAHPHCHVLFKISGSDTRFQVRDSVYPLADNTAVLVNAWEPHVYPHSRPDAPTALILALYIEPAWLFEIEKKLSSSAYPGFFPRSCVFISKRLRQQVDDLALVMLSPHAIAEPRLESQLFELMIAVIDPFSDWRNSGALFGVRGRHGRDPRIVKAIEYLKANLDRQIDLADIARQSGLSRAHFFELFRRTTHLSPEIYANALRMETAIAQLGGGETSMASLADALGFSAPTHFTRFFRHHLGVAPSDYRGAVDLFGHPPTVSKAGERSE